MLNLEGKKNSLDFYINHRNYWLNSFAIAYILIGYGVGVFCLTQSFWLLNLLGVVLVIHTLIWAAYFVHECIHGNIFRNRSWDGILGRLMLFLTGSSYIHYRDLVELHLAHHKNRADLSAFCLSSFLRSLPLPILGAIVGLEWLYFPATNLLWRWRIILAPFHQKQLQDERWRNTLLLLVRGSLFTALAFYSPVALALYFIAYICFLNILRFIDCFQHTYTSFQVGQSLPNYTLEYEQTNTYSNLISIRWSWLNLLLLNFPYHNAHHRLMRCPWYLLPQLDRQLFRIDEPQPHGQYITLPRLIKNYHRDRIHRLFNGQGEVIITENGLNIDKFVGAVEVSFLTL